MARSTAVRAAWVPTVIYVSVEPAAAAAAAKTLVPEAPAIMVVHLAAAAAAVVAEPQRVAQEAPVVEVNVACGSHNEDFLSHPRPHMIGHVLLYFAVESALILGCTWLHRRTLLSPPVKWAITGWVAFVVLFWLNLAAAR
jgi:hypothetical protein